MTAVVDILNKKFGSSEKNNQIDFRNGDGNIPIVEIHNEYASAQISLQGANILSFVGHEKDELIWVSKEAVFEKGKSVRGGVPICWPWFGAHEEQVAFPAHGFARTTIWDVDLIQCLPSGETQIVFVLNTQTLGDEIKVMWPVSTTAKYTLTIGSILRLELMTTNNGLQNITIGEALHTYFNVNNIRNTNVSGLDKIDYLDKPDGFKRKQQHGKVIINEEVDRVYMNTPNEVAIHQDAKKIIIKKQNSLSTIIWNPWAEMAKKMGDLGEGGYTGMLCVESGNVAENVVLIKPGEHHTLHVTYELT